MRGLLPAAAAAALVAQAATAEPHLAIRAGLGCASCHVNRTGGGGRTAYGADYGARALPSRRAGTGTRFDGALHERLRVGADLRFAYVGSLPAGGPYVGSYRTREANLYLTVDLIPERLTLYADERFAPGGAGSREAFALVALPRGGLYAKAGRFFLPYGLRLLDDDAGTRRFAGFSFDAADLGVELGGRAGRLAWAASVGNGTDGAAERDNGKQVVATAGLVFPEWRAGASVASNDLPGRRQRDLAGVMLGARTGPVVWLAAFDLIRETASGGDRIDGRAAHVEIDWAARDGLNVRGWAGGGDPDADRRSSALRQWGVGSDWTPWPGLQIRLFARFRDGPGAIAGARDDEAVVELHLYF